MKTCKEKALEWNVSPRSVNDIAFLDLQNLK